MAPIDPRPRGGSRTAGQARRLAAALAWLCAAAPAVSLACTLQPIAIEPAAVEPTDTYVGRTASLELRFHNDRTSGAVEVFPEPPLRVKHLPTQGECAINDGGVWVRRHVYADAQGQVLVTHEYSGSNDQLTFYDTRSCARLASIDVSNRTWVVEGGTILITAPKAPKATKKPLRIGLDAACLPSPSASSRVHR